MSEPTVAAGDEGPANHAERSRRGWVLVVVAVVLVVAGVLVGRALWSGTGGSAAPTPTPAGPSARAGSPDCPSHNATSGAVPADPSGVDGRASLVPGQAPDTAVVCRYDVATNADFAPPTRGAPAPSPRTPPYPLTGSRVLTSDLQRLAADLSVVAGDASASRPCTMMAGPSSLYLIGLSYGSGRLWVAAEQEVNRCTGATNGRFSTPVYLGDVVAEAYDAGSWTGWAAPEDSCVAPVVGRMGADREMVPGQPDVLTLCEHAADPDQTVSSDRTQPAPRIHVLRGPDVEPVLRSLRDLPASARTSPIECPQQVSSAGYDIVASYAAGPAVRVAVQPACSPAVTTDTMQAPNADPVVAAVKAATGW